jgi:mechanosensitive ion channel-like protein
MDLIDTLVASFNQVVADLVNALPAIIGALLILLVGWIVAKIVSGIVQRLVARAGADKTFAEQGADVYGNRASTMRPSRIAGTVTFWVIMLVFFIAAANFLGWPQVSQLLNDFISWLPNLIVAVIILVAAPIVGRLVRTAVEAGSSQAGITNGRTLGRIAEIAVIAFAVLIAINQVGVATDLVNILFIGVVAALALGFGLAFGLGGRDVAGQVTQSWYDRSKELAAQAESASSKRTPSETKASTSTSTSRPATATE